MQRPDHLPADLEGVGSRVFRGFGTVLNVTTVLVGSGIGVLVGHRLHQRTRDVVTDALGLVTLLVAALSATAVTDKHLSAAVGDGAPVLIVLGALVIGGIAGTALRIEDRLEDAGVLLVGVALRLLQIRRLPVADLLPALLVAPVLVQIVISV